MMVPPIAILLLILVAGCERSRPWPPGVQDVPPLSEPLSADEEAKTFFLPPGYRLELVASEPQVVAPVGIDFDADGRMYVIEMPGYMPDIDGNGQDAPTGRIVVLEDEDWDGKVDRRTVFLDSLVLPRAVRVLRQGVLVGAPPNLWLARDLDGDLRADRRELVRSDFGLENLDGQHNPNGLVWGMDNWLHSSWYEGQLRETRDEFEFRETEREGQWGVSTDDGGHLYRNNNTNPLRGDLVDAHYYARNPNLTRARGMYEEIAERGPVWPVRPNPALTFGYSYDERRPDGTLARFTAAGSPTAYRGDRLPEELLNDVFVTEPTGNLVRRYAVEESSGGRLHAENAYDRAEFIASTDERFRPVNLATAPDGTLYVIDMYRGIMEHERSVTTYLRKTVGERRLEQPLDRGRIWRVVHETTERAERPQLSELSPAALVAYLENPNGWWRSTAQRLLVEHADTSVAPELRTLAVTSTDERARLQALWTLDGLGAANAATLERALRDRSIHVRAAAIRISEPWLARRGNRLRALVLAMMADTTPAVRWQLTASLGELDTAARVTALTSMLVRYPYDPIVVDVAISGLAGSEMEVLSRLLPATEPDGNDEPVHLLAATVLHGGDPPSVTQLFDWIGDEARPREQRLGLLAGVRRELPRIPRGADYAPLLELARKPVGLLTAATARDSLVRSGASAMLKGVTWPGRPADPDRSRPRPLTPVEQTRFAAGEKIFLDHCAGCHHANGRGEEGGAASLVGSRWVNGNPARLARIVLHGKQGERLMPPIGKAMKDEEIAEVLTYVRRAWGNIGLPVEAALVETARGKESGRERAWTEAELMKVTK